MANPPSLLTEARVREIARQEAQAALSRHERIGVLHGLGMVVTIGVLVALGRWG